MATVHFKKGATGPRGCFPRFCLVAVSFAVKTGFSYKPVGYGHTSGLGDLLWKRPLKVWWKGMNGAETRKAPGGEEGETPGAFSL